jgi:hypothetical protein
LERCFDAAASNRRWVADITYVQTFSGWVHTVFVMDLSARAILGWQVADHLRSDLALDALEMAIWSRRGRRSRRLGPSSGPWRPVHVYPLCQEACRGEGGLIHATAVNYCDMIHNLAEEIPTAVPLKPHDDLWPIPEAAWWQNGGFLS